ncbi:MAG: nucleotidyltransferase substrate binding protein [Campylobacterales bacterium]|nr:nucleotidyltransferase substrate binding protein [Campylobacterales bacterium]
MLDTTYLLRCSEALERAYKMLQTYNEEDIEYDIYRSAVIKEFEIILEQSGKLLKKLPKPYFHSSKAVDRLIFKDIFREAGKHSFLDVEEVERWLHYRDNRNDTSHDYGVDLANKTLILIPQFILDTKKLVETINHYDTTNQR